MCTLVNFSFTTNMYIKVGCKLHGRVCMMVSIIAKGHQGPNLQQIFYCLSGTQTGLKIALDHFKIRLG